MEGILTVNWPPRRLSHLHNCVPNYVVGQNVLIFSWPTRHKPFLCEISGRMILVPVRHLLFKRVHGWYLQNETKETGKVKLANQEDGAFIIRPSEREPYGFRLMVKTENAVQQIIIHRDEQDWQFFLEPLKKFHSLNKMVDYYSSNSLPQFDNIILRPYEPRPIYATVQTSFFPAADTVDALPIERGSQVKIIERFGEYWKVSCEDKEGYVLSICLKVKRRVRFCEQTKVCDL